MPTVTAQNSLCWWYALRFISKMPTRWHRKQLFINRTLQLFPRCTLHGSKNEFHDNRRSDVIPKMPTGWQQGINFSDIKDLGVVFKMPTRWPQRILIHERHTCVVPNIHTKWAEIKKFITCPSVLFLKCRRNNSGNPFSWPALRRYSQNADQMAAENEHSWHTLPCYSENAHQMAAENNFLFFIISTLMFFQDAQ